MSVQFMSDERLKKEIFDTLSKQNPTDLGNLVFAMYEERHNILEELGIDHSTADSETGLIEYDSKKVVEPDVKDEPTVPKNDYDRLMEEYKNRFSGLENSNTKKIPAEPQRTDPTPKAEPFNINIFEEE